MLVIIDTLQMIYPIHNVTYANNYRDLSVLKRLADRHGIVILLIHHLWKERVEMCIVSRLSDLLKEQPEWVGIPRELLQRSDPVEKMRYETEESGPDYSPAHAGADCV